MALFHTSCGFPKASPNIFSMFLIIATFWWAFNGYSILFGVGAPWNIKKSSFACFLYWQLIPPSPSHPVLHTYNSEEEKVASRNKGLGATKFSYLTVCANTSPPEKILWDGAMQAALVLTLYQKFTVMVIPPFRRDSMWCHLHGNHIKKRKETTAVEYLGWWIQTALDKPCLIPPALRSQNFCKALLI